MKRIFLESLTILFVCFIATIFAYEVLVYQIPTDYEFVLEDDKASAHRQLIQNIADKQGMVAALEAMKDYARQTHHIFSVHESIAAVPDDARSFFLENPAHKIYFDDDRCLWIRLDGTQAIFSYIRDLQSFVRQKIAFEDNMLWVAFTVSFILFNLVNVLLILRRAKKLEAATIKFAQGDLSCRADESSAHSLGSLNKSFNEMAERIKHLIESNRALTNAVAHELRTPLFRIQWQSELLRETQLNTNQQETIDSIIEDTEEMEQMVEELLHYTKMENNHHALELESIVLDTFFKKAMHRWKKDQQHGIKLTLSMSQSGMSLIADKNLLIRALDNLVRNAFKFARSKILIECLSNSNNIEIHVHDDGTGVAKEHQTHIFEPFYVADKARNKSLSGHGLGLSIVEKICEQHQGTVRVGTSNILGGALFTIVLPTVNSK